jgi:hypothetical protein
MIIDLNAGSVNISTWRAKLVHIRKLLAQKSSNPRLSFSRAMALRL